MSCVIIITIVLLVSISLAGKSRDYISSWNCVTLSTKNVLNGSTAVVCLPWIHAVADRVCSFLGVDEIELHWQWD
jgi:hypothetical protein